MSPAAVWVAWLSCCRLTQTVAANSINFPAFQRLYNATLRQPSLLLVNSSGGRPELIPKADGVFDVRQPAMRKLFVADCLYAMASGVIDGVFIVKW